MRDWCSSKLPQSTLSASKQLPFHRNPFTSEFMPIETTCPGCGRKLQVGEEHAGKQARCPLCNEIYNVPSPVGAQAAMVAEQADLSQWRMRTPEGQTTSANANVSTQPVDNTKQASDTPSKLGPSTLATCSECVVCLYV